VDGAVVVGVSTKAGVASVETAHRVGVAPGVEER
jgi:hypothetical protein